MTKEHFIQEVRRMRLLQKEFYRTRDKFHLIEAKKVEKKVDNYLAGVLDMFDVDVEQQRRTYIRKICSDIIIWQKEKEYLDDRVDNDMMVELFLTGD